MSPKYDLYLSYHHESRDVAKDIYKIFVNEHKLRTCMHDDSLVGGHRLDISMIDQAQGFVCLLNRNYICNDDCKSELKYAAELKKSIFMLRIENVTTNEMIKIDRDLLVILPFATFNLYDKFANTNVHSHTFNLLIKSIRDSSKTLDSIRQSGKCQLKIYTNGKYEGEIENVRFSSKY